jgi:hypothetical protein
MELTVEFIADANGFYSVPDIMDLVSLFTERVDRGLPQTLLIFD